MSNRHFKFPWDSDFRDFAISDRNFLPYINECEHKYRWFLRYINECEYQTCLPPIHMSLLHTAHSTHTHHPPQSCRRCYCRCMWMPPQNTCNACSVVPSAPLRHGLISHKHIQTRVSTDTDELRVRRGVMLYHT